MKLTYFSSIYDIFNMSNGTGLPVFQTVAAKDRATGISGAEFQDTQKPCPKHGTARAHRCDYSVRRIHTAVFDADTGTYDCFQNSLLLLRENKTNYAEYATFSWYAKKSESYRLLVPLARPISKEDWPEIREYMIDKFKIPADKEKCSGASHFFYAPSGPPSTIERLSPMFVGGAPYMAPLVTRSIPTLLKADPSAPSKYRTKTVVSKQNFKDALMSRRVTANKPGTLDLVLRAATGRPLAEKGSRNNTTFRTAGILAWLFRDHTVEAIVDVLTPSVTAMAAAGSSLTVEKLTVMVATAAANCDAERERKAAEREEWNRMVEKL